jgi:hypothetical protein
MPDGRQIDKKARVGGKTTEKAGDNEDTAELVRVAAAKGTSKQVGGQVDTDEVDGEERPGNFLEPGH